MSAPDCPQWVLYARKFIALDDKKFLTKAIEACPDADIRKFLSRNDLGRVPAAERHRWVKKLTSQDRDLEADLVQVLSFFIAAKAVVSLKGQGRENRETALSVCAHCAALSERNGFSECEATFARVLGACAAEVGEWDRSEQLLAGAVQIYRRLSKTEGDLYQKEMAPTLSSLGAVLNSGRKPSGARRAIEEALAIYRDLAKTEPRAYLQQVALALTNLGNVSLYQRDFAKARQTYEEALAIRRKLAEKDPGIYLADVAVTLMSLGSLLRDERRLGEARQTHEEALAIERKLAETEPRVHLRYVAMVLSNLGNVLREERKFAMARQTYEEALAIQRGLAETKPRVHLPDIAVTLNNIGVALSNEHRPDDALQAFEEALAIRFELAKTEPHAYLPDVALSLNNLGTALSDARRFAESLRAHEGARGAYRELARTEPRSYLPGLAMALNNLGNALCRKRKAGDARRAYEEALTIRRELATTEPHIYLPYVAAALNNLGNVLEDSGPEKDAILMSLDAVSCAERGTTIRDLWLAKGQAPAAYQRMLSHLAAIGDNDRTFRCLAAMREGDVRATGTSDDESLPTAAQALLDLEKRLGRRIRIILAQTLTRDGLFLGVLQSEEPYFAMTRADAFRASATALFDEVRALFDDNDKRDADERYQAVKSRGAAAWNALPEPIRSALHPNNGYDVLISGDPYWTAFPWEALRYSDSDTSWLGFRMPLPRWGPITARGISQLAAKSIGDGNQTGFVVCPWNAVRDKQLPGAEREAHEVVDRLRSLGYDVRDFIGSAATPGAMRIALGQAPSILYFTGHGTLFGNEEALVLHDDLGAPSPSYFARREISDLKVSSDRSDHLLSKGSLVVLSSCLTGRTRDFGGQREDLAWALLEEGAEVVIGSPLPMHVSTGVMLGHWLFDSAFADSRGLAWTFARVRAYIEMHARMKKLPTWAAWALLSYHGNPYAQLPHMPKPVDLPTDDATLKTIADELGASDLAEVAKLLGELRG